MKKEYIEHALICVDTKPSSSADNAELKAKTMLSLMSVLRKKERKSESPIDTTPTNTRPTDEAIQ